MNEDKKDEKESVGKLEDFFLKSRTIMLYGDQPEGGPRILHQIQMRMSPMMTSTCSNSPGGHVESGEVFTT